MQIFILDENPLVAASMVCDKHVVKMPVEAAQICSTVLWSKGNRDLKLYKPTHSHHPCVVWTSKNENNLCWAVYHGLALCEEYTKRYKKEHKTKEVLEHIKISYLSPRANWIYHTEFVLAIPEQYHTKGKPVESYRKYYKEEKKEFARWKNGSIPEWFY